MTSEAKVSPPTPDLGSVADKKIADYRLIIFSAAKDTGKAIEQKGQAAILAGGNFGAWASAFKVSTTLEGNTITIAGTMDGAPPYWRIFDKGGTIQGKPLLWIPFNKGQKGGSGGIFVVTKKGLPLILDRGTKQPVRFGKTSVYIPQKFNLESVAQKEAASLPDKISAAVKAGG